MSADFKFRIATIWRLNVGPLGNIIQIPLWQLPLPTSLPLSLPLPRLKVTLDVVSLASQGCCNLEMAIPWVLHPWNGLRCGFLGISGVLHP